ncbi:MAG TPA: hypothetical protein ENN91_04950 [Firmicutes bacterium]|nr:hypothetical protein [Bacillota bacterium]
MTNRKIALVGLLIILLPVLTCSCGNESAIPEEEIINPAEEEAETAAAPDDETVENESVETEEPVEESPGFDNNNSDQSGNGSYPGTVFKHEVKMNIDGVVEKDLNEGWWEEP